MHDAFDALSALPVDGIQLTPGNAPTEGFGAYVAGSDLAIRTHHGFTPQAIRRPVWAADGSPKGQWNSVHPLFGGADEWLPPTPTRFCLETMYPGQPLGSGQSIRRAMDLDLRLAVDVSHIFIQLQQGALSASDWNLLQEYDRIEEVHVSANNGERDSHQPIDTATFGLEWARSKGKSGTPVILESYMHRMSDTERRKQLDIVRG